MEAFSALLTLCVGNSPVTGEFPAQKPVTRSFDVFFDLHLNKPLAKQSWGWWFEKPPGSLWRHCNVHGHIHYNITHWNKCVWGISAVWNTRVNIFVPAISIINVFNICLVMCKTVNRMIDDLCARRGPQWNRLVWSWLHLSFCICLGCLNGVKS